MSVSSSRRRRAAAVLLAAALPALLGGCTRLRTHQGYIADQTLVASVQPGIDNRDSVQQTLGRPSFVAEFDPNLWYYVSRDSRQLAFASPKPTAQMVLAVRFDGAGSVASVKRTGLETIVPVRPSGDKTPTLGRTRSFFSELFNNIGQVGTAGTSAPTQDNPNGR